MHFYAAMRAGMVKNNPFNVFKLPAAEPSVVFLTEEELNLITDLFHSGDLPENEQNALRFFLFMTFHGNAHLGCSRSTD